MVGNHSASHKNKTPNRVVKDELKVLRNLKKYSLEFLLLFLAIFLGFLADGYREKLSEKSKEKKYIVSLIKDVETDKNHLANIIEINLFRITRLDSLAEACYAFNQKRDMNEKLYHLYPSILQRPDYFIPNKLTMIQLKNAGGMRLINNEKAVKAILKYDLQKTLVKNQQEYYKDYHNKAVDFGLKIFNYKKTKEIWDLRISNDSLALAKINYELIRSDKKTMIEFGNNVQWYSRIVNYYKVLLESTNMQADSLIVKLKKEYQVE